jgi:hypothetical protein
MYLEIRFVNVNIFAVLVMGGKASERSFNL